MCRALGIFTILRLHVVADFVIVRADAFYM